MEEYLISFLGVALGVITSLIFEFAPVIKTWFDKLTSAKKQVVISAVLFGVSVVIFGGSCVGLLAVLLPPLAGLTCNVSGGFLVFRAFLTAAGSAQVFHVFVTRPILHKIF